MEKVILLACMVAILAGCSNNKESDMTGPKPGLIAENMDQSVSPATDFYRYVNGGWLDKNQIPSDKNSWGSFNELTEGNQAILRAVVEDALNNKELKGSDAYKAAQFYQIAMDEKGAIKGREALEKLLEDVIEPIDDKESLEKALIELKKLGMGGFFRGGSRQDARRSEVNAYYLSQAGLSLPDRDYYLKKDEKSKEILEKFEENIEEMADEADIDDPDRVARRVVEFETMLAEAFMPRTDLRNPIKTYNKMAVSDFQERAGAMNWRAMFDAAGLEDMDTLIVRTREYFEKLPAIMENSTPEHWRDYLRYNVITSLAPFLDSDYDELQFEFYSKALSGVEEQEPRWKRSLSITNRLMGEALGQLYVAKAFPPEAKKDMIDMLGYIRTAMGTRIDQLPWMTDETKKEAQKKLASIRIKIGYPDEWKDYSELELSGKSYADNILAAREFFTKENIDKFGEKPDPNEWGMTPPTVNAYYSPLKNEIVFPAGILQPPFYGYNIDPAVNFGGIGGVIGHEISHGFDDSGRRYDYKGNLQDWWTKEDDTRFRARADKLVAQAASYTILDSLNVNGRLTLGENIADLGGILIAYEAFKLYQKDHEVPEDIGGFTPDQRFFMAWSQVWRRNVRDKRASQLLLTDSHAPGEYRGKMPLTNIPAFWAAFDIPEGSPMRAPDSTRVEIW